MGIGCIKAPSEGEAQAAGWRRSGLVYAAGSQDYDTMLFGAPRVVRNLTFSGRRKLPMKNIYVNVEPEIMELQRTLEGLGISRKQLIWLGILIGTDFNEGVDGVGPKTALKIAKASNTIEEVEEYVTGAQEELRARHKGGGGALREAGGARSGPHGGCWRSPRLARMSMAWWISCATGMASQRSASRKFTGAIKANAELTRQKGIEGWM